MDNRIKGGPGRGEIMYKGAEFSGSVVTSGYSVLMELRQ